MRQNCCVWGSAPDLARRAYSDPDTHFISLRTFLRASYIPQMRKSNGHLSDKNVLSNFLKEFLLRQESVNLAGRSFQTVGPETLNDLGPNVIVLVLGMYSCPDVVDRNCLRPDIDEIEIQSSRQVGKCQIVQALVHQSGNLEDYSLPQR